MTAYFDRESLNLSVLPFFFFIFFLPFLGGLGSDRGVSSTNRDVGRRFSPYTDGKTHEVPPKSILPDRPTSNIESLKAM